MFSLFLSYLPEILRNAWYGKTCACWLYSEADHYSITVRFKALEVFSAENSLSLILASEVDVFSVQTTTAKARKLAAPVDPVKFKKHLRIVKAGSQPKIPLARDVCFPFDPS
ncbi:hypothetical protein TWF173_004487 [Orbilia oligospora]|nr:hypothetical protein TWF173_004487 [Orbilia oligospora]